MSTGDVISPRPAGPGGRASGPRHRVAIVVLDGTLALDIAVAIQAFGPRPSGFRYIRDEAESPYEVVLCGSATGEQRSAGFSMLDVAALDELPQAGTVLVPGVDEPERPRDPLVLAAIAEAARRGARLVSLCAGAFVLGQAGVLAGRRVTTHWALADDFRRMFPDVEVLDDELFVDDGQVLTSGGMLAAADLCLHIIRGDLGQSYANDISRLLVYPPSRPGGQTQYMKRRSRAVDGSLGPLMSWMLENLDEQLSLHAIAQRANLSMRTLSRRFEAETGGGVLEWIATRRIEHARALLEDTDMSVTDIAFATGFGSLATFRRQFARLSGTTPREYRRTFRVVATAATVVAP
jgi:AraC family transcriptional regulator, transcriptional activator FtrA